MVAVHGLVVARYGIAMILLARRWQRLSWTC